MDKQVEVKLRVRKESEGHSGARIVAFGLRHMPQEK